jgi:hypothetical protein
MNTAAEKTATFIPGTRLRYTTFGTRSYLKQVNLNI